LGTLTGPPLAKIDTTLIDDKGQPEPLPTLPVCP